MLADPDTYWHLVVGRDILHNGSVPTVNSYSYTRAGAPWIAKEWLSQILFYAAWSRAGWFGVCLLTATIAASAYAFLFAWLCRRVAPIVALTMTAVTVSLCSGSLLARPQIFFYLLLIACACGLVGAVETKKTPWWLPLLVALWANLHASFPIALVLAAVFGLEAVVSAAPNERGRTAAKWALVLLASLAAAGATPYGYGSLVASLKIIGSKEVELHRRMETAAPRPDERLRRGLHRPESRDRRSNSRRLDEDRHACALRRPDGEACPLLPSLRHRRGGLSGDAGGAQISAFCATAFRAWPGDAKNRGDGAGLSLHRGRIGPDVWAAARSGQENGAGGGARSGAQL